MRSKIAMAMDFYVLLFTFIMIIFFSITMNLISSSLSQEVVSPSHRGDLHGNMFSRFLMTPADEVIDDVPAMTIAEYITMKMDDDDQDFDESFEDYLSEFRNDMCATIGRSNARCGIEISKEGCSGCSLSLGSTENTATSELMFTDDAGDEYVMILRLHDVATDGTMRR